MARAEFHFAGGPDYCRGCADLGLACATGTSPQGRRCTYEETAPVTGAGWQAWDVACKCAGQLRLSPGGSVVGLDFPAAFTLAEALGYDRAGLAELLPAIEVGMVKAINERIETQRADRRAARDDG